MPSKFEFSKFLQDASKERSTSKSKRKKSKKQPKRNTNETEKDFTTKEMGSPELETNNESNGQKDASSLLASTSVVAIGK